MTGEQSNLRIASFCCGRWMAVVLKFSVNRALRKGRRFASTYKSVWEEGQRLVVFVFVFIGGGYEGNEPFSFFVFMKRSWGRGTRFLSRFVSMNRPYRQRIFFPPFCPHGNRYVVTEAKFSFIQ